MVETTHMSVNEKMDKQNVIFQTIGLYSAIRWNEVLTYAKTCINLENSMLSNRKTLKATYYMILFIWNI